MNCLTFLNRTIRNEIVNNFSFISVEHGCVVIYLCVCIKKTRSAKFDLMNTILCEPNTVDR